jgi:hypothetical protein
MLDVEEAILEAEDIPERRVEHSPKLSPMEGLGLVVSFGVGGLRSTGGLLQGTIAGEFTTLDSESVALAGVRSTCGEKRRRRGCELDLVLRELSRELLRPASRTLVSKGDIGSFSKAEEKIPGVEGDRDIPAKVGAAGGGPALRQDSTSSRILFGS